MGSGSSGSKSTSKTSFSASSQNNPFYQTTTDKKGNTKVNFVKGSAGETAYNYVNNNISSLLNDYLNPSLDSVTNKAKLNAFNKTQQSNLQNNIINPLANNGMIRSSQATNMYNNLSNQAADYGQQLLGESQDNTWNMINNLISMYTQAYTGANSEEGQSINASLGAGTTTSKSTGKAG